MIPLVTLEQAKLQLHIDLDVEDFDDDVEMKILQASALMLSHLKIDLGSPEVLPWTDVPPAIEMVVLSWITQLHERREAVDLFSPGVLAVLSHYRMPTMAGPVEAAALEALEALED